MEDEQKHDTEPSPAPEGEQVQAGQGVTCGDEQAQCRTNRKDQSDGDQTAG